MDKQLELTIPMLNAGVEAFERWNPIEEEVEALVTEVFFAMLKVRDGLPLDRPVLE